MMPLSHGSFPFLLILCFISFRFPFFRLHVFFPYLIFASDFDLTYLFNFFSSSVFSSCFCGDFNIIVLQFYLYHVYLFFTCNSYEA